MLVPSNLCVQYDSEAYMKKKWYHLCFFGLLKFHLSKFEKHLSDWELKDINI
jgi:hypothetical protein